MRAVKDLLLFHHISEIRNYTLPVGNIGIHGLQANSLCPWVVFFTPGAEKGQLLGNFHAQQLPKVTAPL